jgi:hypothetical protein
MTSEIEKSADCGLRSWFLSPPAFFCATRDQLALLVLIYSLFLIKGFSLAELRSYSLFPSHSGHFDRSWSPFRKLRLLPSPSNTTPQP